MVNNPGVVQGCGEPVALPSVAMMVFVAASSVTIMFLAFLNQIFLCG